MTQDKGKYIIQSLRNILVPSAVSFLFGLMAWGPREALLLTALTFSIWMLGALAMFDLSAARVKRALNQISGETVWHDVAVFVDFPKGIVARGLLALTGSELVYIAFQDRAPRLDLPIRQILHAGFGELPRSVSGLKIRRIDGMEHMFIMGEVPYQRFLDAFQQRKREMP